MTGKIGFQLQTYLSVFVDISVSQLTTFLWNVSKYIPHNKNSYTIQIIQHKEVSIVNKAFIVFSIYILIIYVSISNLPHGFKKGL